MPIIFQMKGTEWFTTDPEVVPGSKNLAKDDYVRLPNGLVYLVIKDDPFALAPVPQEILNLFEDDLVIIEAKAYDVVNGCLCEP